MTQLSYRRHRFPAEIIQHAIWLYLRFTLSYRDVEELPAERGVDVSYETVRRWVLARDQRAEFELGARADRLPRQHRTGIQTREIEFARSRHFWSSGCRSKLPHKPILYWIDHRDPSLRAFLHDPGFTVERTNPLLN
jgi:hypothetical protein